MVRSRATQPRGTLGYGDHASGHSERHVAQTMERTKGGLALAFASDHYSRRRSDEPLFSKAARLGSRIAARFAFVPLDAYPLELGPARSHQYGSAARNIPFRRL